MSRIIVDRHEDGSQRLVVGWDHPAGGAFWQEWASKQEVADAEEILKACEETGAEPSIATETLAETGVKREGGMWPGIKLDVFKQAMPEDLQPLITDEVMEMLKHHADDPDSGYVGQPNRGVYDLTAKGE